MDGRVLPPIAASFHPQCRASPLAVLPAAPRPAPTGQQALATAHKDVHVMPAASLLLMLMLMLIKKTEATATTIHFVNECTDAVVWYDGSSSRAVASGTAYSTQLAAGDNAAYRAGVTNDATLAEFAVDGSRTWYDISIIPAGPLGGPGSCSSLDECKEVTGGQGFNVAMRIVPSVPGASAEAVCRTLSCLADGCEDAYQYPDQPDKTHSCAVGVSFEVIFCPSDASASASGSSSSSDWVPLASASGSGSGSVLDSNEGVAASNSSSVASDAETATNARSTASAAASSQSGSEQQVSNNGGAAADSNSSAVIVVVALSATAVVIVLGAIVARHWRTLALKWEAAHWHKPRSSSPTLSFVELDDPATPQGSRAL